MVGVKFALLSVPYLGVMVWAPAGADSHILN